MRIALPPSFLPSSVTTNTERSPGHRKGHAVGLNLNFWCCVCRRLPICE